MQDIRLALRALRSTPVVSAVAVLSLALGIGANTAIFSLVHGLLLRGLPVPHRERLATISTDSAIKMGFNAGIGWNYPMWAAFQARSGVFEAAGAWKPETLDLSLTGEKDPARALITSGGFFEALGIHPAAGRSLSAADDVRGGGPDGAVAVISHDFWQRRFQGAASALGATLSIERVPFRIVGIMPRGFRGFEVGKSFDVALTLGAESLCRGNRALIDSPQALLLFVMVRLKEGQSIASATPILRTMQPEMHGAIRLPSFATEPMTLVPAGAGVEMPGSAKRRYERPLVAILIVTALVLLVACANIANLLLARVADRRHELSVRLALGAPRWSLARQLLVESLVLSTIGAAGGVALAVVASQAIARQLSMDVDTSLNWQVLAFTALVTTLTAIVFGSGAAIRSMRAPSIDALKQGGRGFGTRKAASLPAGLVVVQVAVSLMLIACAGLFVRSFARLSGIPMGFDKAHLLLARVDVSRATADAASRVDFYQRLADRVASVPGVTHAAASFVTPLDMSLPIEVPMPGAPEGTASQRVVLVNRVTPGWFTTYSTPMLAGRDFDSRDDADGEPVVIINRAFAQKFFPSGSAVGQTISQRRVIAEVADQIVQGGFHADGRERTVRDPAPPTMYVPLAQLSGTPARSVVAISIQTAGAPSHSAGAVSAALASAGAGVAFSLRPLADELADATAQDRIVATLSGFFGTLAVLLAALGLYGVTSYAASRQRAEIGIRIALGAAPGSVVRLVLTRVAILVGIGIAAGLGLTIWTSTYVASLLYEVSSRDALTLAAAVALLAAAAGVAGGLPAIRASRIDPITVLRES